MDSHVAGEAGSFDVQSTDGTTIKVWMQGEGPPIVLVHGSLRDHTMFEPLVAQLHSSMTTYAIDRRGFGGSGDRKEYAIEREFEDVAAVVEVIAANAGAVALCGHSYGAGCAMGAAALADSVSRLILYRTRTRGSPTRQGGSKSTRPRSRPAMQKPSSAPC